MDIRDYWVVISKRWWIIAVVVVAAVLAAYAGSKVQQPIFRSTARLYVMPGRVDYGNVLVIQNLVRQYSQLVLTDKFLNAVGEQLKLDLPPETMRSRIHTSGTAENLTLQIEVDDPDQGQAQRIARGLALEFVADQERRMKNAASSDRIDVFMYDEPSPALLHSPQTRVNVMAGALLGVVLGGILVFSLEYLDDTIKTGDDVERYVALPVVGSIPPMVP